MSITVFIDGQIQSDKIADTKSFMAQVMPDTRSYDGCQGVDVYFNLDDPVNMVVVEQWESLGHFEKYQQWRKETGIMDKIVSMQTRPPSIQYFERADA